MDPRSRFRALSLDLWFTALYYAPEREDQWKEDRARLLRDSLLGRSGQGFESSTVAAAIDSVHARLRARGREPITLDPEVLIPLYAENLNADLMVPLGELARTYSEVGLAEHPPIANPEAVAIVQNLAQRQVPVIAITNSARRGQTWQEYVRDRMGIEFRHVVSSCDCGAAKPDRAIFMEAASRTGVPPSEILHIGDRWELDVEGALRAGFGAALYRGLWRFYPEGEHREGDLQLSTGSKVPSFDRLDEVLDSDFLT